MLLDGFQCCSVTCLCTQDDLVAWHTLTQPLFMSDEALSSTNMEKTDNIKACEQTTAYIKFLGDVYNTRE